VTGLLSWDPHPPGYDFNNLKAACAEVKDEYLKTGTCF